MQISRCWEWKLARCGWRRGLDSWAEGRRYIESLLITKQSVCLGTEDERWKWRWKTEWC